MSSNQIGYGTAPSSVPPAGSAPGAPAGPELGPPPAVLDAAIVGRLERLGDATGEDLLGQLSALFLIEADARIVALHRALAEGDAPGAALSAHTLRGASANLGATGLAEVCATLSAQSESGDLDGGGVLLARVEAELGEVRSALGTRLAMP